MSLSAMHKHAYFSLPAYAISSKIKPALAEFACGKALIKFDSVVSKGCVLLIMKIIRCGSWKSTVKKYRTDNF